MLNFETIKSYYDRGLWSSQLVLMSVKKGVLTDEQAKEILGVKEE